MSDAFVVTLSCPDRVGIVHAVTGLLVDESLVTIAGAGVAGVGLYLYLRNDGTIHVDP